GQAVRPVARLDQLSYYPQMIARVRDLAEHANTTRQIAEQLNADGLRPPKRTSRFTRDQVLNLLNRHGIRIQPRRGTPSARAAAPPPPPARPPPTPPAGTSPPPASTTGPPEDGSPPAAPRRPGPGSSQRPPPRSTAYANCGTGPQATTPANAGPSPPTNPPHR